MSHYPLPAEPATQSRPIAVDSFEQLTERYNTLFLDAYGVLKNSQGVLPGVLSLLQRLQHRGLQVFVLTNDASKSPTQMSQSYLHSELGALLAPEQIICSGRLAQQHLKQQLPPGRVAYFGKVQAAHFITQAGHEAVPISQCSRDERVDAIAFLDDEGFDWSTSLTVALNMMRRREVPVLVANSDRLYPINQRELGIAVGSLANMLEDLVGWQFTRFGKPDPALFAHAFGVASEKSSNLSKTQVLMVGDTLRTDILGANRFGVDSVLVLSGNTAATEATLDQQAAQWASSREPSPTYLCRSIASVP